MAHAHIMTVSRNGQVSIPAAVRARWQTSRVVVADLGDHIAIRPLPEGDPISALRGKYAGMGPDSDTMREMEREAEAAAGAAVAAAQTAQETAAEQTASGSVAG